jgi:hypothetical protein
MGSYSQHFIFFTAYEWALKARVLHYNRLERIAKDKHSSLFGPFISCKKWSVVIMESYPQHFIFFITYKCALKARVLHYNRLERLAKDKH